MLDAVEIWEKPTAKEIYMFAGWRQWADAGSISSGLPGYLIKEMGARQIGTIKSDGFYLFQIPGTHDLVRPQVKFEKGYPETLQVQRNEIFYSGNSQRGLVFFLGDEPHLDIERYVSAFLHTAQLIGVKRIIGFGGVYGEVPYDKERLVSCIYSPKRLSKELSKLSVNLSDYQGGASIGSYVCKRAGDQGLEYVSFFAFVPTYDFTNVSEIGNSIRIENDYMAWLAVMRRINYMLKFNIDLTGLEEKSQVLLEKVDAKIEELDGVAPQLGVRDYLKHLSEEFKELPFDPLDDVWEDELRRLSDKFNSEEA